LFARLVLFIFLLQKSSTERPPETGRVPFSSIFKNHRNQAKEIALRKEKAFLHTFAAGQKYGVWRYANRRF